MTGDRDERFSQQLKTFLSYLASHGGGGRGSYRCSSSETFILGLESLGKF